MQTVNTILMKPLPDKARVDEAFAAAGCSEEQWVLFYVKLAVL